MVLVIRRLIVKEAAEAKSVDAWLKLRGYISEMLSRRYVDGLDLFNSEELYRTTVDLSLSDNDTVMLFVRGVMGDVFFRLVKRSMNQWLNRSLVNRGLRLTQSPIL